MNSLTHIAGADVIIGGRRLRQRCSWCGAVLIDMDLATVAVQVEPGQAPSEPASYQVGSLVRVTGNDALRVFETLSEADTLPADACGRIDDEVTR